MAYADLHIHSIYSWDGVATVSDILRRAKAQNLNWIAISDHDTFAGSFEAQQLASEFGVGVIPSCEVSTREGHLLTLFVQEVVPAGLSLVETVRRVAHQGGLCVAAHAFAADVNSISLRELQAALLQADVADVLIGVEVYNGGLAHFRNEEKAKRITQSLGLAETGSSDAHVLAAIGCGVTVFPGNTADDLRSALLSRQTSALELRSPSLWDIGMGWLVNYMLRKLGRSYAKSGV
jgi:predicted metal-dependent phosphoesterase TrpH